MPVVAGWLRGRRLLGVEQFHQLGGQIVHDRLEHDRSMLGPGVGRSPAVLRFHGPEADNVAVPLARTYRVRADTRETTILRS